MDYPWVDSVKQKGELQVYRDGRIAGMWSTVFHQCIAEFNRLSSHHNLGVVLKESKHAPVDGGGGADVKVSTANGPIALNYDGKDYPDSLIGFKMHGITRTVTRTTAVTVVEKAFIFLPQEPKQSLPGGLRPVGNQHHEGDPLSRIHPRLRVGSTTRRETCFRTIPTSKGTT